MSRLERASSVVERASGVEAREGFWCRGQLSLSAPASEVTSFGFNVFVKDEVLRQEGDVHQMCVQGYLAHKTPPPSSRTTIGPLAQPYHMVLGGGGLLWARCPSSV